MRSGGKGVLARSVGTEKSRTIVNPQATPLSDGFACPGQRRPMDWKRVMYAIYQAGVYKLRITMPELDESGQFMALIVYSGSASGLQYQSGLWLPQS